MKESLFQHKVIEAHKQNGWIYFNLSDRFTAGIPDTYFAKDGRSRWLELKVFNQKSDIIDLGKGFSKPQKINVYKLRQAGVEAWGLAWIEYHQAAFYIPPEDFEKKIPIEDFPKLYKRFDFKNP